MYTRKLYATGSATANNVANIVVPSKGFLVAIGWAMKFDSITDNATAVMEISLASATEVGVLGAQQCISELCYASNFVTSGLYNGGVNLYIPVHVPIAQGQQIYLHAGLIGGTLTYTGGAILWLR